MRTLLDDRFAPITSSIGFVELGLDEVAAGLEKWRRILYPRVEVMRPTEGFPEVLRRLEPLITGARPRELLVGIGQWTAYFDCHLYGTDTQPVISYLCRELHSRGLTTQASGRTGAVEFQLVGPVPATFLNFIRGVTVAHDGKWLFSEAGPVQPFEEPVAYGARRVRDRFTSDMLKRYCLALGVDVFNGAAYGPDAVLITSQVVKAKGYLSKSLAEAQHWLGITPGTSKTPG
jgi:hypothetical protein